MSSPLIGTVVTLPDAVRCHRELTRVSGVHEPLARDGAAHHVVVRSALRTSVRERATTPSGSSRLVRDDDPVGATSTEK